MEAQEKRGEKKVIVALYVRIEISLTIATLNLFFFCIRTANFSQF